MGVGEGGGRCKGWRRAMKPGEMLVTGGTGICVFLLLFLFPKSHHLLGNRRRKVMNEQKDEDVTGVGGRK